MAFGVTPQRHQCGQRSLLSHLSYGVGTRVNCDCAPVVPLEMSPYVLIDRHGELEVPNSKDTQPWRTCFVESKADVVDVIVWPVIFFEQTENLETGGRV